MTGNPKPEQHNPCFSAFLTALGRLNYTYTNTESLLIHLMAGLLGTSKEAATIVFLTLNTTRARTDLVERLAKCETVDPELRRKILSATRDLHKHSPIRNRFNHCIYAFDDKSGQASSIHMRIADKRDEIKMGQHFSIDQEALSQIEDATETLHRLNLRIWHLIGESGFPV